MHLKNQRYIYHTLIIIPYPRITKLYFLYNKMVEYSFLRYKLITMKVCTDCHTLHRTTRYNNL